MLLVLVLLAALLAGLVILPALLSALTGLLRLLAGLVVLAALLSALAALLVLLAALVLVVLILISHSYAPWFSSRQLTATVLSGGRSSANTCLL